LSKTFVPVQGLMSELTTEAIQEWFRDQPDSVIIRSILVAEVEEIRNGEDRERRTLRGVWYDRVKPLLSRAGILNKKTSSGGDVPWERKLSEYLAELVRIGFTSYEELLIVDGSRHRQQARDINYPLANIPMVGGHFPWVILFTEKDTIWSEVQSIADLYGVSAISGSGYPSAACTENTIRAIIRSDVFQLQQPEKITLISLTDYDPHGYEIAETQYKQINEAVSGMDEDEREGLRRVTRWRIGLEPEQLTPEERLLNSYEPKRKGLHDWFKQTGGVEGQPLGIELDALPLSRLRGMFAEAVEQVIDMDRRRQDLQSAYLDLVIYDLLLPEINTKREAMIKTAKDNCCWDQITRTDIPEDLFKQAAINGDNWINVGEVKRLFEGCQGDLVRALREV